MDDLPQWAAGLVAVLSAAAAAYANVQSKRALELSRDATQDEKLARLRIDVDALRADLTRLGERVDDNLRPLIEKTERVLAWLEK